jgi:hypothetical protein
MLAIKVTHAWDAIDAIDVLYTQQACMRLVCCCSAGSAVLAGLLKLVAVAVSVAVA